MIASHASRASTAPRCRPALVPADLIFGYGILGRSAPSHSGLPTSNGCTVYGGISRSSYFGLDRRRWHRKVLGLGLGLPVLSYWLALAQQGPCKSICLFRCSHSYSSAQLLLSTS